MVAPLLVWMAVLAAGAGGSAPAGGDRAAYEAAAKAAGGDASAQVRLALWCEAHGMTAERMKHLAAAVVQDPGNALARGLMGMVARGGKWERPEEVSREVRDDPRQEALTAEYLRRRAKAAEKAEDQWKLALWCEQNGLEEQAVAHYYAVLRRDPRRDAVWKHLGFKKVGGRWVKPEWQEAARREAEEQARASKRWKPILERYRSGLSGPNKVRRGEAEAGLLEVTDPRAVPMVWAVLVARGPGGHKVAVQVLGQIDSPGSSRALALLALRSPVAEVRGDAIRILRRRDPRDFAPLLIAMLRERIRYEVRPVKGPGSPGELLIKNKGVNVDRVYAPPAIPFVPIQPGDSLGLDGAGLPVIDRYLGQDIISTPAPGNSVTAAMAMLGQGGGGPTAQAFGALGLPPNLVAKIDATLLRSAPVPVVVTDGPDTRTGTVVLASRIYNRWEQIPIGEMMLQSQMVARAAERQLEGDVQAIQSYNASVQGWNQDVLQVLSGATGVDLGESRATWEKWIVDLFGYAYSSEPDPEPPTVVEQVPLAYQPQPIPAMMTDQLVGSQVTIAQHHSCFGAGTPVRTLDGSRPIESMHAGDLVLTQDPRSGGLAYRAIVAVYHNPPNATFRVTMETDESIVATGIHRLWKAGKGWAMARDLKPGDVLRALGGVAAVKAIEPDRVQPVYNLRVAEGESYFVGGAGVLAHDNSTIEPVDRPFDAVGPLPAAARSDSAPAPRKSRSMLGR